MELKQYSITRYVAPKTKKKLSDMFWVVLFPLIGISIWAGGTASSGANLFDPSSLNTLAVNMLVVLIACFALNTNLNSGRMDFSLGAVGILGTVIAWKILPNRSADWYPIVYLLTSMVFSTILGFISGLVFVILKIPAIVVSLGMCLIYEGIAFALNNGESSIQYNGNEVPGLFPFFTNPWFLLVVFLLLSTIMLLLLKYSKFGHDKLSLLYGQKVSVDTGVNEFSNALICYSLAGALIAIFTVISTAQKTQISIATNLGSAMTVMANFLPIFLGGLIAKHSNEVVGLALGVISVELSKYGLKGFGVDNSVVSLITSLLIFAILTYMVNWTSWVKSVKTKIKNFKLSKYEGKKSIN